MTIFKIACLFLLLQVSACGHSYAQQVSYTRYNTRDGLAASTVYCMTQDKTGFIWFGTEAGLSRFDGTHFRNFTVADGLPGNEVFSVFTDSRNHVWMMCFENEICYYYQGKIYNGKNNAVLSQIKPKGPVGCIAENDAGEILINSPEEIYTVRDTTVRVIRTSGPDHNPIDGFNAISGTGSPLVSIAYLPGYIKRQLTPGTITSIPLRIDNPAGDKLPYYVCHPPFAATEKKCIYLFRGRDTSARIITIPEETSNMVFVSGYTYAFLRPHNGVTFYDIARQQITGNYLASDAVQYVLEDREQNLWFATKGAGVVRMSHALFRNYSFDNTGARYIQPVPGKLLIGADNAGLWTLPATKDISTGNRPAVRASGPECSLTAIIRQAGNVYINYASSDFLQIGKQLSINAIKSLHINGDTILAATAANCIRISAATRKIIDTLHQGRATCAYYSGGQYYIGTLSGLIIARPGKAGIAAGDQHPVLNGQINQVTSGDDGTIWVATNSSGIAGYKDGLIVAHINAQSGLTSDLCRCLFIRGNTIWAGTDKGLNKISGSNGRYTVTATFTSADGLNADLINTIYSDGALVYAGTPLGLTVFDDRQTPQQASCTLVLNDIVVSGKPVDPLQNNPGLSSRDNNIRFSYSGISFLSGSNIDYRYRLLGLNDQWATTTENHLDYPSLPANTYKLQIQAINKFGNKSNLVEYDFKIAQKTSEKAWFQVAVLLAIIAATSCVIRYLVKRSHRKEQEKVLLTQKMVALEQMALRAQMNPHFIFNCLNSMQQYILSQDVKSANFYLTRFARLVRQTLDNSSRINITIEEEIQYLKNYLELERLQVSGSFNYRIEVSELIDPQSMLIPNMVLQPYVENAIKHGVTQIAGDGFISIEFRLPEKQLLECIIEDNGPGINSSEKVAATAEQSHGMSITSKRIRTLDQLNPKHPAIFLRVVDIGQPEQHISGTRVTIRFPV